MPGEKIRATNKYFKNECSDLFTSDFILKNLSICQNSHHAVCVWYTMYGYQTCFLVALWYTQTHRHP